MSRGSRRRLAGSLLVALLAACSTIVPTPSPRGAPAPSSPAPTLPEPQSETPLTQAQLLVDVRNRDSVTFQIAWAEDLDRLTWAVDGASFAHLEVTSTRGGTLLTQDCNFAGTWEIGPGSYSIVIDGGTATLTPVEAIGSSVGLAPTEPCPHQGP
jgi:hypothetical protein